ncbi:MAG: hypothetical protein ACXWBN_09200 [Acidimicrobiales bacterium]
MADGTKAGGDAPRTLFSLGRSGKRKGRAAEASPLEDYPPRHAEEASTEADVVATLESTDPELEATRDDPTVTDDGTGETGENGSTDDAAAPEPCPSCSLPLVPGAMFCGECGTRVLSPEEAVPAAVLLDDEVPGEPLPPEAEGSFEVAEPVTGSLEDDESLDEDDPVEDEGHEIEESTVFGAFIGAEDEPDVEPEAELVEEEPEAELAEEEPEGERVGDEPEAELVEDGSEEEPEAELVEEEPEGELVGDEPEAELVEDGSEEEPEGELVGDEPEAELVEDEDADHDGAVVALAAGATAGAAGSELASADSADAASLETSEAPAAGGSGGGSKKGVWIGAAAAAAAVVLIIGVVAMGGSGGKSDAKKDDQVAAGSQKSTTTTAAASSTTGSSTVTTEAPTTSADPATTDTTAANTTVTTAGQTTSTTVKAPVGPPPPPPPASPANVQVSCPGVLASPSSNQIVLHNIGGTATSFLVTWSALKTGVSVSPTTGSVGANSAATISVNVAPGTPGSGSRVTIKWSGGATSCNLLVQ